MNERDSQVRYLALTATCGLIGLVVLNTVSAGSMLKFLTATAAQLYSPASYVDAVLPGAGGQLQ